MDNEENVEIRTSCDFVMVASRRVVLVSLHGARHVTVRRYCANTGGNELPRLALLFETRHAYPQHKHGVKTFNLLLSLEERTVHRRHQTAPTKQMDNATRTTAREGEL